MRPKIDFTKLSYHEKPLSMEEALKDIVPLDLPEDVLSGGKQLKVTGAKKDVNAHCVKLEISY